MNAFRYGRYVALVISLPFLYWLAPWLFLPWPLGIPLIRDSWMLTVLVPGSARWIAVFSVVFVWIVLEQGLKRDLWRLSAWKWAFLWVSGSLLTIQLGYAYTVGTNLELWLAGMYSPSESGFSLSGVWEYLTKNLVEAPLNVLILWWHVSYYGGFSLEIEWMSFYKKGVGFWLFVLIWWMGMGWVYHRIVPALSSRTLKLWQPQGIPITEWHSFVRIIERGLAYFYWFVIYLNWPQFAAAPKQGILTYIVTLLLGLFAIILSAILSLLYLSLISHIVHRLHNKQSLSSNH